MDTLTATPSTQPDARGARTGAASWPAFTAWGAGLIQIALGAGAITGEGGGLAAYAGGFLLITSGVAAIGWGAATLARGRVIVPRAGLAGSLISMAIAFVALAIDPVRTSIFAVAAASVLLVAVALGCALAQRRRASGVLRADAGRTSVVGIIVGAVLVAGLVTPALAATEAGQLAPDHGEHGVMEMPGHH